jgi:hypothetical protein
MSATNLCSSNEFIVKCNEIIKPPFEFGYQTISSIFSKNSTLEREKGDEQLANALQLASEICSMRLNPKSINEPFIAITSYNDSEGSWRSTIPDDLTDDQLNFIADVYIEITEPMIKARFADLLWILFNPKKIINAQTAIENYLLLPITYKIANLDVAELKQLNKSLITLSKSLYILKNKKNNLVLLRQKIIGVV